MKKNKITSANIIDRLVIVFVPVLVGFIGVLVIAKYFPEFHVSGQKGLDIVKSVFDVWGILLGFVITAVSILLTANRDNLIDTLIATNHMQSIIFSYISSSAFLFLAIVYALIVLILQVWGKIWFMVFTGLNIVIIVSVGICIYFLFLIMLKMNR